MKREEFTKQFRLVFDESNLSYEDAAAMLKISLPTVKRWYSGDSAPHKLGRDGVINILDKFNRKNQT
jgi:DNA-binding transcriptional regulator YiaG